MGTLALLDTKKITTNDHVIHCWSQKIYSININLQFCEGCMTISRIWALIRQLHMNVLMMQKKSLITFIKPWVELSCFFLLFGIHVLLHWWTLVLNMAKWNYEVTVCKSNLCDLNTPFCSVIHEREGIPLLWTMSGPPTYILFKPSVFKEAVNEQKVCLKCFKQWMICLR